ncbi:MAG TPA: hypothetical protein VMT76_11410 [Puia sp.]|nr:hypothetical protein [Puia sp.]
MSFTLHDLIGAIAAINNSYVLSKSSSARADDRKVFYPFAEIGFGSMSMSFDGIPNRLAAIKYNSKIIPKFVVGAEMRIDRKERLFGELFASMFPYSFEGANTHINSSGSATVTDTYIIKAAPVQFCIMVNYAILKIKKMQVAIGAGYSLILNNISKNSFTTTDKNSDGSTIHLDQVSLSSTVGQYCFDADFFLNKKMSVRFQYSPVQDFSGLSYSSFKNSTALASFKYRF